MTGLEFDLIVVSMYFSGEGLNHTSIRLSCELYASIYLYFITLFTHILYLHVFVFHYLYLYIFTYIFVCFAFQ